MPNEALNKYIVGRRQNILVIDDSAAVRKVLVRYLTQEGFNVLEAEDGVQGLKALENGDIPTVICDWEMPNMDGLEFCRRAKKEFDEIGCYILMLTANTERDAIKQIFDAGADDYLTKPIDFTPLMARLHGGLRIIAKEDDLRWYNGEVAQRERSLAQAYAKIRDDLVVAESVQRRSLPNNFNPVGKVEFAGIFEPAFHTAGDIFNYIELTEHEFGAFSVDVSGHGVASSLMAVTVAETLCVGGKPNPILFDEDNSGKVARDPALVVEELNQRFVNGETDHYFTLTYCVVNKRTRHMRYCQAGHPPLLLVGADGHGRQLGAGGLPVGMFEGFTYDTSEITLAPRDRIYLFSDGIPEAEDREGEQFGEENMLKLLASASVCPLDESVARLVSAARTWRDSGKFADDVSVLGFELPT